MLSDHASSELSASPPKWH